MTERRTAAPARCLVATLCLLTLSVAARAAPVLMVSVDGLKPEYVLEARQHGLKLPFLTGLLERGSYADGVTGVWPTVTYPSHTTLVTGVEPARHGIYNNPQFDPLHDRDEPWYWYAAQIQATTLWQAAHAAHQVTASVGWPVTVGADIDYLIPEFWRIAGLSDDPDPSERYLIGALSKPAGLVERLAREAGPYRMANDTSLQGDAVKARYASAILRRFHPRLMTVHLSSLDSTEHSFGPFSAEADADVEALDPLIAQMAAAAHAADPATVVVVVSDHGFVPVAQRVNLAVPFVAAGLIELSAAAGGQPPRVQSWLAQPWMAGGMAAIMLKDPADRATAERVGGLLHALAGDPANGIAAVRSAAEMRSRGGFPGAEFVVEFAPGYYAGGALAGPLVTPMPAGHGGHGYSPEEPAMRAAFFIAGTRVAAGRDFGVIDMRQVAPTVAAVLGVPLPGATAMPLPVLKQDGPAR